MIRIIETILFGALLFLWTLGDGAPMNFSDFDLYQESTAVINKACPVVNAAFKLFPWGHPDIEHMAFQLRTSCVNVTVKIINAEVLRNETAFDVDMETVVLVTGWRSHLDEDYTEHMAMAYNCRGGHNFLVVDTADYINTEFIKSASNVEKLGEFIAIGLHKLSVPPERLHLIGHSLGAHIMSSAGRSYYSLTGQKVKRITGLDPARPCFKSPPVFTPLSRADANFVDIIHSNPSELGLEEPLGHADFYPNGLIDHMPGCSHINIKCSHVMSLTYYTESVYPHNDYNFMGTQCNDYKDLEQKSCKGPATPMGYAAAKSGESVYLLSVNDKAPYGMNTNSEQEVVSSECGLCEE